MGRSPCCDKVGLKKGPWTPEEDQKLTAYIEQHGHGNWRSLPAKAGLQRCGKSCRLRWINYLRPDIKRGKFSLQEDRTIIQLHALLGNKWSIIAAHLPKRTDNEIKNYWNTHLKKKLTRMGIDPITHKPKDEAGALGPGPGCSQSKDFTNLSHIAQWESARLEAEARLVRESKLQFHNQLGFSSQSARLVINKIPAQPSVPPCLDILKAWQNFWSSESSPSMKDNNDSMVHINTYPIMLAPGSLDSPTSTLIFPGGLLPPNISNTGAALTVDVTRSLASCNVGSNNMNGSAGVTSLQDDDIMVAMEAFTAARYEENNSNPLVLSQGVMDGLHNDELEYDDCHEKVAQENGDGSCNGNFEEENMQDWNCLVNLVNQLPSGSPVC